MQWTAQIHAEFHEHRATWDTAQRDSNPFAYGAITLCGSAFQHDSAKVEFCNSPPDLQVETAVPRPPTDNACRLTPAGFRLFPFRSPLLRKSHSLSLPRATEMFHFTPLALHAYFIQHAITAVFHRRVTPFGNPRIFACLVAPRGLSHPATSFIASWRQGIRHTPLVA